MSQTTHTNTHALASGYAGGQPVKARAKEALRFRPTTLSYFPYGNAKEEICAVVNFENAGAAVQILLTGQGVGKLISLCQYNLQKQIDAKEQGAPSARLLPGEEAPTSERLSACTHLSDETPLPLSTGAHAPVATVPCATEREQALPEPAFENPGNNSVAGGADSPSATDPFGSKK